ncbi:hypothetical protein ACFLR1_06500, partial [Bacteroidota bacterium]
MKRIAQNLLTCITLFYAVQCTAQNIRAEFASARFYSPEDGPYLETYLKINGGSVLLNTQLHAEVGIT